MLQVKQNFSHSHKDQLCPVCKNASFKDDQAHLLHCKRLHSETLLASDLPEYEYLFSNDIKKIVVVVKLLKENLDKRKKIENEEKTNK